ncbi:MAG: hypothetical protein IJM62_05685, partial [Lachnospiraceae bacterium]|nr:hypothetical protein [Lachnospiraceae bacterium]
AAFSMKDQVPESIKRERSAELIELAAKSGMEYTKRHVGRNVSVLTEQEGSDNKGRFFTGYTKEYIPVKVYGQESGSNTIITDVLRSSDDSMDKGIFAARGEIGENDGM